MAKGISIRGLGKTMKELGKTKIDAQEAVLAAVLQGAYDIDRKSVRLVPVNLGTLLRSHFVARPTLTDPTVIVGYGTEYAVPVHERTKTKHKVGQAKYLKQPYDDVAREWRSTVAKRAKSNLKNGVKIGSVPSGGINERPVEK